MMTCTGALDCNVAELEGGGWPYFFNYSTGSIYGQIPYYIHEFGVMPLYSSRNHKFSYWPGISLNPGLWDLEKIRSLLEKSNLTKDVLLFKNESPLFEQQFSLLMWFIGAKVSYLGAVLFRHIGDISSYTLNNVTSRPWDSIQDKTIK